jgi:hypothetical protein
VSAQPRTTSQLPRNLSLSAFPNPFNSIAQISFSLPRAGNVKLEVYDVTGRLAATLVDGRFEAGEHRVRFDGKELASGIYFLRLRAEGMSKVQKVVMMR